MPVTTEEMLKKLTDAIEEAHASIRVLHEARAAANDVIKSNQKKIADLLIQEVEAHVKMLYKDSQLSMTMAVEQVIKRLETDWRKKLGLEP